MSTDMTTPETSFIDRFGRAGVDMLARRLGELAKTPEGRERVARIGTMMANVAARAESAARSSKDYNRAISPWLELDDGEIVRATKTIVDLDLSPVGAVPELYAFPERGQLQIRVTPAGFVKLAARAGQCVSYAVIYEGDEFDFWQDGAGVHFRHRPVYAGTPARSSRPLVAVAVVVRRAVDNQIVNVVILDTDEINRRRLQSKMPDSGPWAKWFIEMAKKVLLHRALAEGAIVLDLGLEHALSVGAGEYDREVYDVAEEAPRARIVQPPPAPALAAPPPSFPERARSAAPPNYTDDEGESYGDPSSQS